MDPVRGEPLSSALCLRKIDSIRVLGVDFNPDGEVRHPMVWTQQQGRYIVDHAN